ncbi:MAG: CPBP family intramembrane metalloprotease [Cytophagales bacterium]|nr:MAG: CPBP family intramembrane metalloprotease [Cytophagales bacterium]
MFKIMQIYNIKIKNSIIYYLENIHNKIKTVPLILFICFSLIYTLCVPYILVHILDAIGLEDNSFEESYLSKLPLYRRLLITGLIAPLIETFLFQYLIINILQKIKILQKLPLAIIIISACLFASTHIYSLRYILVSFLVGFYYAYAYIIKQHEKFPIFWLIAIIHSLHNLVATLILTSE